MFIEIYSKPGCPNCEETKKMLDANDKAYKEYVVGKDISREDTIARFPEAKVVPIVVVDGRETKPGQLKNLLDG